MLEGDNGDNGSVGGNTLRLEGDNGDNGSEGAKLEACDGVEGLGLEWELSEGETPRKDVGSVIVLVGIEGERGCDGGNSSYVTWYGARNAIKFVGFE